MAPSRPQMGERDENFCFEERRGYRIYFLILVLLGDTNNICQAFVTTSGQTHVLLSCFIWHLSCRHARKEASIPILSLPGGQAPGS